MRVALVIYGSIDTVSGGYLYDRKLVAYLRRAGDEVRVISIPPRAYIAGLANNLTFRLPVDVDLVVEDELVHSSVLLANRQRPAMPPVLSLVHNLHSSERRTAWQNALIRQLEAAHLRSVDGYIFNSPATRQAVRALVEKDKPFVLAPPAGDRLGSFTEDEIRRRLSSSAPLRLLFLATVTPLKGLHVVLDALTRLPAGTCTLDVAGSLVADAGYARRMRRRAYGLPSRVRFHGVIDNAPLAALLKASDLLVIPSYYEGFGISYLEGMAFGLPAVGTTAGAIPQMIRAGENGYMIAPGDSGMLAEVLSQLASDRDRLLKLSLQARSYFAERPTWDESGEMVRGFLQQIFGSSR